MPGTFTADLPRPSRRILRALVAVACILASLAHVPRSRADAAPARSATSLATLPAWLDLRPGTRARVDIALWATADEPEAELTASRASLAGDLSDDTMRPGDVVYEPTGVRVRVVRAFPGSRIVLVHGIDRRFQAYTRIERLIPDIPPGTRLRAAGGFGGFADFYPTIVTPNVRAKRLATGSDLVALGIGAAPFDPGSSDLVRVRVRVLDGNLRGDVGFVAVDYTGLPGGVPGGTSEVAEKACACHLIQFASAP